MCFAPIPVNRIPHSAELQHTSGCVTDAVCNQDLEAKADVKKTNKIFSQV